MVLGGRVALLALCVVTAAAADPVDDARAVSADPDTPVFSLARRNLMRGSAGGRVPLLDSEHWRLEIPLMIELHNEYDNVLPNNFWRGLIGLSFQRKLASGARLELELHHESDHQTAEPSVVQPGDPIGFYEFNSLGVAAAYPFRALGQQFVGEGRVRLHFLSCNVDVERCATGLDGWGSQTGELSTELTWLGSATASPGSWQPEASLYLDYLIPHGLVREESRLVANVGLWLGTKHGVFQIYGLGWLGDDVGFTRHSTIQQLGIGLRWSP